MSYSTAILKKTMTRLGSVGLLQRDVPNSPGLIGEEDSVKEHPILSVILPTRNASSVLGPTLEILRSVPLGPELVEFVIAENSDPRRALDVESVPDERFRLVRTENVLAMKDNFAFGMEQARGQWLTFIGSDDGVIPENFVRLVSLLETTDYDVISTDPAYFLYPGTQPGDESAGGFECMQSEWKLRKEVSRKVLRKAKWSLLKAERLPIPYNRAVVRRSVIQEVKSNLGEEFMASASPDLYLGWAIASIRPEFLRVVGSPAFISGVSALSNGRSVVEGGERAREFMTQNSATLNEGARVPGVRHSLQLEVLDPVLATSKLRQDTWRPKSIALYFRVLILDQSVPSIEVAEALSHLRMPSVVRNMILSLRRVLRRPLTQLWSIAAKKEKLHRFLSQDCVYITLSGACLTCPSAAIQALSFMPHQERPRSSLRKWPKRSEELVMIPQLGPVEVRRFSR